MLYIFDLDGTLTNTPWLDKQPRGLLPGRRERIAALQAAGHICAIATNQGGVAFGFMTEEEAVEDVASIARELEIDLSLVEIAFGHPTPKRGYERYASKAHLDRRKPAPGMLQSLIERAGNQKPIVEAIMIGDRDEDRLAAEQAGCAFCRAADFFEDDQAVLWRIFTAYRRAAQEIDDQLTLLLKPDGTGAITWRNSDPWIEWWEARTAPALIAERIEEFIDSRLLTTGNIVEEEMDPFLYVDEDEDPLP